MRKTFAFIILAVLLGGCNNPVPVTPSASPAKIISLIHVYAYSSPECGDVGDFPRVCSDGPDDPECYRVILDNTDQLCLEKEKFEDLKIGDVFIK